MNMQSYLPSKKIQITLMVLLLVACAYLFFYFYQSQDKVKQEEEQLINVALVDEKIEREYYKDSDNDGAYDWQEALWPELDPNNPDSDGDGVLDGKYIKTKQAIYEKERRNGDGVESNLSQTEKLGRGAYTALLAIAQSDQGLDGKTQEQFSDNIADYISELTLGEKTYTRDELSLVEDSQEKIYAYRKRMQGLFRTYPVATTDIELVLNAVDNPLEYRTQIREVAHKYSEYVLELSTTETPYIIAGRHTELLNNISQMSAFFDNLLQDEVDELVSLSFLVQIETIMNETAEAIVKINTFFELVEDTSLFES